MLSRDYTNRSSTGRQEVGMFLCALCDFSAFLAVKSSLLQICKNPEKDKSAGEFTAH